MTHDTLADIRRDRLIRNILALAARKGLPLDIAVALQRPVRVYDPMTDLPVYVALRDVRADHVRCD